MQKPKVELCDICGDHGLAEAIDAYCIGIITTIIPKDWLCEPCQSKHVPTSPCKVNQDIGSWASKKHRAVKTAKVKFRHLDEVIRLSSQKASAVSKNVTFSLAPKSNPQTSPPKVLGKLPRNDEVHKKPMTNQHVSCSLAKRPTKECIGENQQPLGGLVADKKVRPHVPQKEKPTKRAPFEGLSAKKSSPLVNSGGIFSAAAESNQFNIDKSNRQRIQKNLNLHRKFLPSSIPSWRGQIQILQTAASGETYDGFEAQPPCVVKRKAYEFSREMPSVLQLESLSASNVLTDIFWDGSPKLQDIALYFFPSKQTEKSKENLNSILKFMNAKKSMLRSYIDGVELMVFTSNQLDMDSRGAIAAVNAGHFLWGLFRQNKIDKAIKRIPDMEPVDMDIDMIGGKDVVGRVDHVRKDKPESASMTEYRNKLDVPPGFEAFSKMSSCNIVVED
ncbi:hypothetical protein AAZX31_06G192800 [Glycine max]|uniref:AIPP2-like SPOC-like domain-containing protein n=1 Tax=Glycine max TaxID=3847 RepID=K7KW55_SOYBN|nr:uncharacterized protein LOC100812587 [Glycine max]KAG4390011.1 hypothetical protein GLYMA_06G202900v4 [Glycine max]KAG4390012.1 hypothetical protein GLYMA_06G202900v4 [Glycine max]KAH1126813.1 hypothetical protein GYH30_015696 [Glycine max]KAH1126814.1 hypothetical protein GYH30_015696 [Glycine max]KAH1126815.1 hypothetical protein GYH30_015696 [Glycine max]|eukprot:XP_003527111.2 uncharacterized protein LOC100812587 [Glycine max]